MQQPILNLDVKGIVLNAMNVKVNELLDYIVETRKMKKFDKAKLSAKTTKKDDQIFIKVFYKGDLWLNCCQQMGINGIEHVSFESKYIFQPKDAGTAYKDL